LPGALARGNQADKESALAENELPRRFSPGLASRQESALAKYCSHRPAFSRGASIKISIQSLLIRTKAGMEQYLAKAEFFGGIVTPG